MVPALLTLRRLKTRFGHSEQEERPPAFDPPLDDSPVPPSRVSVIDARSFDHDAQALADSFKRQQPVILNLQRADRELSRRMVDFCAGLTYALDGRIQPIANQLFLLTPRNAEVSDEQSQRLAKQVFFNQL